MGALHGLLIFAPAATFSTRMGLSRQILQNYVGERKLTHAVNYTVVILYDIPSEFEFPIASRSKA
jgi:hypothetical protein